LKESSLAARYPKVQLMVARIEINRWVELQMNIIKRFFNFKLMLSPYEAAQVRCVGGREKGYGFKRHFEFPPLYQ
jgi:hypothetical protein